MTPQEIIDNAQERIDNWMIKNKFKKEKHRYYSWAENTNQYNVFEQKKDENHS